MIRKIRGKVISAEKEEIIIEVGNVTIGGFPSYRILKNINTGDEYNFETSLEMNEWNMSLYFFYDETEKKAFSYLKKVSKIGPKTAAKITLTNDAESVIGMIAAQDTQGLSGLPGIGKKTAERIISELKNEFENMEFVYGESFIEDAVEALETLGYDRFRVLKILSSEDTKGLKTEDIIKIGLNKLK